MNQEDEQQGQQEQTQEATAPDGLMAQASLAEDKTDVEEGTIPHLVEDSQEIEAEDEDITYERPDWFPDKFWDEKEGPDLENIVKSFTELEKKFHSGDHKAPTEYKTDVLTEAGYDLEDPLVGTFMEWSSKYGVNQAAFDELAGKFSEMAIENGAEMQINLEAEKAALGANGDAIVQSNVQWADGLERKGIISSAEREELNIWGGTAVGQRLMQKVRSMTGDMSKIPIADVAEAGMSDEDFKSYLRASVADPRWKNDPKFQAEIQREAEKRFG